MRRQAFRPIAATLCLLLAVAAPARAATITFTEVVRTGGVAGGSRSSSEVRLRVMPQSGNKVAPVQASSPAQPDSQQPSSQQPGTQPDTTTAQPSTSSPTDPTLSQSGGQVETVDLGDVTGTVCDCGEIPVPPVPKGGIPWWLGFAGIPLICVSGICFDDETRRPPTTPTPTPEVPIPEPATLILFGSGLLALGARARRRLGRKQLENEAAIAAAAEEV